MGQGQGVPVEEHNAALQRSMNIGDLVVFPRTGYSHWAVYIGSGKIIHLTCDGLDDTSPPSVFLSAIGRNVNKAVVKEGDFRQVAGTSRARKNNEKDKRYTPFDVDKIKARAESKLGTRGYNIIWKNCEHFANWCRYGEEESDQVTSILGRASTVVCVGAFGSVSFIALRNNGWIMKEEKTEEVREEDQPNEIILGFIDRAEPIPGTGTCANGHIFVLNYGQLVEMIQEKAWSSVAISEALDRVYLPTLSATDPDYYPNGTRVYHGLSNRNWKKGVDLITGGKSSFDAMLSNPGSTYINLYSGLGNLSYINLNNLAYCPLPVDVCYPKLGRD